MSVSYITEQMIIVNSATIEKSVTITKKSLVVTTKQL